MAMPDLSTISRTLSKYMDWKSRQNPDGQQIPGSVGAAADQMPVGYNFPPSIASMPIQQPIQKIRDYSGVGGQMSRITDDTNDQLNQIANSIQNPNPPSETRTPYDPDKGDAQLDSAIKRAGGKAPSPGTPLSTAERAALVSNAQAAYESSGAGNPMAPKVAQAQGELDAARNYQDDIASNPYPKPVAYGPAQAPTRQNIPYPDQVQTNHNLPGALAAMIGSAFAPRFAGSIMSANTAQDVAARDRTQKYLDDKANWDRQNSSQNYQDAFNQQQIQSEANKYNTSKTNEAALGQMDRNDLAAKARMKTGELDASLSGVQKQLDQMGVNAPAATLLKNYAEQQGWSAEEYKYNISLLKDDIDLQKTVARELSFNARTNVQGLAAVNKSEQTHDASIQRTQGNIQIGQERNQAGIDKADINADAHIKGIQAQVAGAGQRAQLLSDTRSQLAHLGLDKSPTFGSQVAMFNGLARSEDAAAKLYATRHKAGEDPNSPEMRSLYSDWQGKISATNAQAQKIGNLQTPVQGDQPVQPAPIGANYGIRPVQGLIPGANYQQGNPDRDRVVAAIKAKQAQGKPLDRYETDVLSGKK